MKVITQGILSYTQPSPEFLCSTTAEAVIQYQTYFVLARSVGLTGVVSPEPAQGVLENQGHKHKESVRCTAAQTPLGTLLSFTHRLLSWFQ